MAWGAMVAGRRRSAMKILQSAQRLARVVSFDCICIRMHA